MKKYRIKYKAAFYACLFLAFSCISCQEEEEEPETEVRNKEGIVIEKDFLWKADISGNGLVWPTISPAIYDGNIIMAGATDLEKDMLVALDIKTGKEVWRWTDFFTTEHASLFSNSEYGINQKENIWILQNQRYFYAIDVQNGLTIWRKDKGVGGDTMLGVQIVGNSYYYGYGFLDNEIERAALVKGNINTSNFLRVVEPEIDSIQFFSFFYGNMDEGYTYEENGEVHAFLQFSENVDVYQSKNFNYIASYNVTTNDYDFPKTRIGDTARMHFNSRALMHNEIMIINPDSKLVGVDKRTGEVVWRKASFRDNGDGSFTTAIYNDKLYAVNLYGLTGRVLCLDPLTGRTIWEDLGRGNSVHSLHFLNDVMYFTSRGDGKLYAYDTENGELLWRLNSPDFEYFQGYGGLRTVPGKSGQKGKVIASTYLNAYCFEAER